jgi:hypothetical protein
MIKFAFSKLFDYMHEALLASKETHVFLYGAFSQSGLKVIF